MDLVIGTTFDYSIPIETMLTLIRRAGFNLVSIGGKRRHSNYHLPEKRGELRALLTQRQLVIDSIHAPFFRDEGDIASLDQTLRQAALANIKNAIEAAHYFDAHTVIIHPGSRFEDDSVSERFVQAQRSLEELIPYARALNVRLACENVHYAGGMLLFEELMKSFSRSDLGICYDSSHGHALGRTFEILERHPDRIWAVHIADDRTRQDDHLLPYEGNIDWSDFARVFPVDRYKGSFLLEVEIRNSNFKDPATFLEEARRRGEKVLNEVARRPAPLHAVTAGGPARKPAPEA